MLRNYVIVLQHVRIKLLNRQRFHSMQIYIKIDELHSKSNFTVLAYL